MTAKVTVTKTGPGIIKFDQLLQSIQDMDVLIGIPEEKTGRKKDEGINNAELLYLHTKGSPANNIPKRPVIEPAIQAPDNQERILKNLAKAARSVLEGKTQTGLNFLKLAGLAGKNAATRWFVDPRNNWPPNAPATIAAKEAKMTKKSKAAAEKAGNPLTRPLIDTGQLRKALTFVVRSRKND